MAEQAKDRWWCSEGCGFVEESHRCEQWCLTQKVEGEAIDALLANYVQLSQWELGIVTLALGRYVNQRKRNLKRRVNNRAAEMMTIADLAKLEQRLLELWDARRGK